MATLFETLTAIRLSMHSFMRFILFLVGTGGRIVGISSLQQIMTEARLPKNNNKAFEATSRYCVHVFRDGMGEIKR